MLITPVTLLILAVSAVCVIIILRGWSTGAYSLRTSVLWLVLWLGIAIPAAFPELLDMLLPIARMQERLFFALVGGVFVLFLLTFMVFGRLDRLQQRQAKIVRALALRDYRAKYRQG
jgi:hypothetical protein